MLAAARRGVGGARGPGLAAKGSEVGHGRLLAVQQAVKRGPAQRAVQGQDLRWVNVRIASARRLDSRPESASMESTPLTSVRLTCSTTPFCWGE